MTELESSRRVPHPRPPPVPGTHVIALRPSSVPLRVPLPPPPESSLPAVPDLESDFARAACPTVPRLLATVVTDLSFESTAASALVAEHIDFAAASRLDSSLGIVAQSKFNCPPSVGGECALDLDVLEDRQEDFDCLANAVPHLVAMLLAPKETWMHQTSRPRALTQSQRQGIDFFQTFSPTPKMTTLRVLLHVSAQCDYELHSLDFSTAFLQGSLHEEIWLRRPPGFNGSFPAVFATAGTEALALVKSELQKRHTCTDLGELRIYLGLQINRDRARHTITLTRSHMVHLAMVFASMISGSRRRFSVTSRSLMERETDMRMEPPNRDAAPSSTYVPSSNPVSEPDSPNKGNPTDRRGEVREGRRSDVRVGEVEEVSERMSLPIMRPYVPPATMSGTKRPAGTEQPLVIMLPHFAYG
ncbi:unnamed protein product, partial [Closterium sp. NIES-54]